MPAPDDFETVFAQLTPFLLSQGWLLSPKILGGELDHLWDRCQPFLSTPPTAKQDRQLAENEISQASILAASHPNHRAYYVWLAMQQPHVSLFSHLIEAGTLHYFRRDYLSCIHLLVPAVEGVLRSHHRAHVPNHQGDVSYRVMRTFLHDPRPTRSYPELHKLYREALAEFLGKWLWVRTDLADWDLSHLNRHYILHGLGNQNYYRSEDCTRLLMFLDLYMEMLVLETGVGEHPFIPVGEPALDARRREYTRSLKYSERMQRRSPRLGLLRDHPQYHDEHVRESLIEQVARWARVMGLDRVRRWRGP